ncbi:MAG: RNA polymerase sigma factor (sigma-70 family), partial [Verrucomicrobiales bacterium]
MEVIHQTDRELLRAWLNGQEAAFGKLVERHAGLVFSVAVRQTGDRTAAEEVAQDVFAVLARKARALLHHPSVPAWLHTTSRNIARRERAKLSSHHRKLERLGEELRTKGRSENSLPDDARIDGAISKLPVNEREVILLRFFEDRDYSEIAVRLSINEAAARKRCSRGLQRLEKALQQRLGEGAHLASMAIPVPATLVAAVVSSTGKASASATATGAAGALATTFGMITMNTLAKTTIGTIAGAGLAWFGV